MPIQSLETPQAVGDALAARRTVLLKHSTRCPLSAWAWEQIVALEEAHPDLEIGWVDVVRHRALSEAIAAQTEVPHESPQVFVIVDGRVVHHASHLQVVRTAIEEALGSSDGPVRPSTPPGSASPD